MQPTKSAEDHPAPPVQIDFAALFAAVPSPLLVLAPDAPHFAIIDVNQAYLAATMRTRADLVGRGVFEAFPDDPEEPDASGVANLRASLERALRSGRPDTMPVQKYDIPLSGGGFEERWWDPVNTPILDAGGSVVALVHQVIDATNRIRADAAHLESERELRRMTDALPVLVSYIDQEERYRFVNKTYEIWFGHSREQMRGRHMREVLGDAAYRELKPAVQRALSGERSFFDSRVPYKDGGTRDVHVEYVPRIEADGQVHGFYVMVQDIGDRVKAERSLRESEARFRNMADHAPVMMWVTDEAGYCIYLNKAWYDFTGQTEAEAEGLGWLDATHPEDRAEAERVFLDANAAQAAFRLEYRLRRSDGAHRWAIDAAAPRFGPDGDFLGYVGSVIDIDERRESEEALSINEERLRLATEAAELGFWDVDVVNNRLVWPPLVKAMFGISPDVPVTMDDFYANLHPDDQDATSRAFAAACDPAIRALYDVEYRTTGKEDGVTRWVAAKGRALFDESGRCLRVVGTAIDVTDRKAAQLQQDRAAEALAKSEAQLRFLSKLDDALRSSHDAPDAMLAAATLLGQHLHASRCAYADLDSDNDRFIIRRDFTAPGIASSTGAYSLDLFGPRAAADMREGRTLIVRDVPGELAPGEGREMFGAIGVVAIICCPLVRNRRLVAMMAVHQDRPRDWDEDEISLVQAVVERCWAYVERVGAEARLRSSEVRYRQIVEGADDFAIIALDKAGMITSWNVGAERLLGFSEDEAVGQHGSMFFTPEDRDAGAPEHELSRAESSGRAVNERWHVRKDGTRFWGSGLLMNQEGGGFLKMFRDRTAEHEAEARLRDSEERYRALFTSIESGFCVVEVKADEADGRIDYRVVEANPAFYRQTGFPYEIFGRWLREAAPDLEEYWYEIYGRVALTGEAERFEQGSDTLGRWFDVYAFRIGAADERRVAILFNDISQRKAAEDGLRELNDTLEERVLARTAELESAHEQLRQSQKMEAMGQLTGGVAHDFNNLLTPIVGALDLLQRRSVGGEREQRLIDGAAQSADRAKTLVQRLLAFARRSPLQPTAVDIAALTRGMAELVSSTTGPQIKVVVDAPEGLPAAKADPNQLEMAILNLAVNARDAMPEGGTLRISASAEEVGRDHPKLRPGQYVRLSVADTGVGMDEATLARAVEPFFSTKGIGKGTGLGLSMVHGLASQLGGALLIHSQPGVGTNIEFWLHASDDAATPPDTAEMIRLTGKSKGRALIVDDEEFVRASTADMLLDLGHDVVEAESAEAALRLIGEGLRPDLLLTDHLMPGMTGADLASEVRARLPDTAVLIVSGYAEAEDIAPDLPRLTKPFGSAELAAAVAEAVERHKR